jgi:hypothetical protein
MGGLHVLLMENSEICVGDGKFSGRIGKPPGKAALEFLHFLGGSSVDERLIGDFQAKGSE